MTKVERIARLLCDEVNDASFDHLPQRATYLERKTYVNRAILDRREALEIAERILEEVNDDND